MSASKTKAPKPQPIRRGDVFDYAGTGRAATVMDVMPGGRLVVRIEGYRDNGAPLLRVSDEHVRGMREWARLGRADYLDGTYASALHLARHPGAGTMTNPLPADQMESAPVGAWVRAGFAVAGREPIYQIREVPLDQLVLPELDSRGNISADRRCYVDDYTRRAQAGEQAPNARGLELEDGRVRVQDGHRRAVAARNVARGTLRVAVSPFDDPHVDALPMARAAA